jgi:hypothetical protein
MNAHGITRTAVLPFGFRAKLSFTTEDGILTEWLPGTPRKVRSWTDRRFLAVYGRAKEAFIAEIQVQTGARVDAADYIDELGWEDPPPKRAASKRASRKSVRAEASPQQTQT